MGHAVGCRAVHPGAGYHRPGADYDSVGETMSLLEAAWLILAGLAILIILYLIAMMLGALAEWVVLRIQRMRVEGKHK